MSWVLIKGFAPHKGALPRYFFMVEGEHGLKPLRVDGRIPNFASEASAQAWHRAVLEATREWPEVEGSP